MRAIFTVVLLAGVALAGGAVYLANGYFSAQKQNLAVLAERAAQVVPTVDVVVLRRPVDYGDVITAEHLATLRWPEAGIPEGTFTDIEALLAEEAPRIALRRMEPGEPLMAVKVTDPGQDAGIGSRLGRGMRAYTVAVDATSGVSGFLRPDDRVDIYWTGGNGRGGGTLTRLVERNMRIMAIDQDADTDSNVTRVANTVTFEVTPQQVAALTQAQAAGRLTLSLVGHGDETVLSEAIEIDTKTFLGIEDEPEPEPEPEPVIAAVEPETCSIRTRRGADVVEIPIPCKD